MEIKSYIVLDISLSFVFIINRIETHLKHFEANEGNEAICRVECVIRS